jgi:hypothetical protein
MEIVVFAVTFIVVVALVCLMLKLAFDAANEGKKFKSNLFFILAFAAFFFGAWHLVSIVS